MSVSGIMNNITNKILTPLIPPDIGKGELVTGTNVYDEAARQNRDRILKLHSSPRDDKIPVPPGDDGTVLQADSTTNTGLRWVPHEPIAKSLRSSVNLIVEFLKPLVEERVIKETDRLQSIPSKIFIRPIIGALMYCVPFQPTDTVQNLINYLNKTFLVYLIHGDFTLRHNQQILEPERSMADYNISNDDTLYIGAVSAQSAGKSKTIKNKKLKGKRHRTSRK